MKKRTNKKSPVAKAVRTPQFRMQVVRDRTKYRRDKKIQLDKLSA